MNDQRIVIVCFAGREVNMEVQWPSIARLLDLYPNATFEAWNLTRNESDNAYVRGLGAKHERVMVRNDLWPGDNDWPIGCRKKLKRPKWCGCKDCRPAPYEAVYAWYAERPAYSNAVFMKVDDDLLWLQTGTYAHVLEELAEHPHAVISACVVNNVVSAKHTPELRELIEGKFSPATERDWFMLHVDPEFARVSHDWLLDRGGSVDGPRESVRALPGERPSINCISFTWPTMVRMAKVMGDPLFRRMGDEGTVCQNFLPRIVTSFQAAHLQFGPQRLGLPESEWDAIRQRYAEFGKEYLP